MMGKTKKLEKTIKEAKKEHGHWPNDGYETCFKKFQKIKDDYTLKEIVEFSQKILSDPTQKYHDGFYLSALINQKITPKDEITLKLEKEYDSGHKEHKRRIAGLCHKLPTGKIIIKGNVGAQTCKEMQGGKVVIKGNVGAQTCKEMQGGKVVIKGNAERDLGRRMQGGSIKLFGNAEHLLGTSMQGGSIKLFGNAGDDLGSYASGGNIKVFGNARNNAGYRNTGTKITVWGNAEGDLGQEMIIKGEITLVGNAGPRAGHTARGGKINICGNAEGDLGACMENGEITVWGNTEGAGRNMQGGLIKAKGKIKNIPTSYKSGIIIEKGKGKRFNLTGWDFCSIAPFDEKLPDELVEKALKTHMERNNYEGWRALVQNPERYETCEYKLRLKRLNQELPVIIQKITEPEKKLRALKALEQEVNKNSTKEVILLAQACGANVDEATKKYNQKIKEERKRLLREML